MNEQILYGKNCLITGATGGLGKQIALQLAKKGCNIFLTSKNSEKLNQLKTELSSNNQIKIGYESGDLRNTDDINRIIKKTRESFAHIDILVNCAAIFPVKSLAESALDDFDSCMSLNVRTPFLLCKEFSNDMIKNNWGRIINIASSGAYNGRKNTSIYRTSKHALLGLSRTLHSELKEHNVRTFCISPGPIKTEMGKQIILRENPEEDFENFIEPDEIAQFVIFIISFNSEMISEEIIMSRISQ